MTSPLRLLTPLAVLLAVPVAGCATLQPLRAAEPAQAVADNPGAARAEAGGLVLTARPDDWRGWPWDLPDHLTPVLVLVENRTGGPVALAPEDLELVLPDGRRLAPLRGAAVRGHVAPWADAGRHAPLRGWGPPGLAPYWLGWPMGFGPSRWWDEGWALPAPPSTAVRADQRDALAPGRTRALLLFYPVPAVRLDRLALELGLAGAPGAGPRLDFVRRPSGT